MCSLRILFVLVFAVSIGACGVFSSSGGGGESFESTLEPSQWQDGDWTFSALTIYYETYDGGAADWEECYVETDAGTLTLNGNGLSGTAVVSDLYDGDATYSTPGDTLHGFTVGDTLAITGHVDGTTVAAICTAPNGTEARIIGAPYDGDVADGAGGKWNYAGYFDGMGDISTGGTYGGADSSFESATWSAPPSSSPPAVPVVLGKGPVMYAEGSFSGDGGTYLTHFDGSSYGYEFVKYDIEITILGNQVSGTLTFTDLDELLDFEGYEVGDSLKLNGEIRGDIIYIEATDPLNAGFAWHQIWGGGGGGNGEPAGTVDAIDTSYGVTYQTPNSFGGENYILLYLD